ncbi:MAG: discoidin domain-containing protein, partial [Sedimentisphaerales bacterium]
MCRKLICLASFILVLALAGTNVAFGQLVWEGNIQEENDDVEEQLPAHNMYNTSSDVEMPQESVGGTKQIIGLRFTNVRVPQGITVLEAWIQFQVDETKGGTLPVSLIIEGELSPNAGQPGSSPNDLTNRPRTEAKVVWEPPNWTSVGDRGPAQQTSDISSIIQEITNQSGWYPGNALLIIISDNPANPSQGLRCAEAGPGDDSAMLHIEYVTAVAHATQPSPADGAIDIPRDVTLSWEPGDYAPPVNGHTVYFSESFDDVNAGIGGVTQSAASYTPAQRLDFSKTYYWRVDEVNGPPDFTVHPGKIWSFTTELFAYPIQNITATASSQFNENTGPENTIDGSGLDENDLHSTEEAAIWLSSMTGAQPTWIQYEFDRVYKLHEMWVWNFNQVFESAVGFGFKDVTIEYSNDGANWTTLDTTHEFARAPGMPGYAHNTIVAFGGVPAKYVKLTANSNWGGVLPQFGLSEVRFFQIPVVARAPDPPSGTTDVPVATIGQPIDVTLSFVAGREAANHNVYLSTDQQAVIDETISPVSVPADRSYTSYNAGSLDLDQTYYWKVNEVNDAETPTTWQGEVWNFSTQKYLVVDDFEDYNDFEPDRIFDTWIDGWGVPANGSQVGYAEPTFVETTIVHSGKQSMPFHYDNTAGVAYSEAERSFASPQDWTVKGATTLSLWFRGNPVAFQESPPGTF